jgi:hypothetical protein
VWLYHAIAVSDPSQAPPEAVGGWRTRRAGGPKWTLGAKVAGAALAVLIVWLAACGLSLIFAYGHLRSGADQVERLKSSISGTDLFASNGLSGQLETSEHEFASAHREVGAPWLIPWRHIPVVGRQLQSVTDLSGAAEQLTGLGASTLDKVQPLLHAPATTGAQRLEVLNRLAPVISVMAGGVAKVNLGPTAGLIKPLFDKRAVFATDLSKLDSGVVKANAAVKGLLGVLQGRQTYLVFASNNAEMRAGSGTLLQVGSLSSDDGNFKLGNFHDTKALLLPPHAVHIAGDLAARWGWKGANADFRELDLSPQFQLNAPVAAEMWQAKTGQHVNGVISLDVAALAGLLSTTGPVNADGLTLSGSNAEQYLLHDEYVGESGGYSPANIRANLLRDQRLSAVLQASFDAFEHFKHLSALAKVLAGAADGRHVLMWSSSPQLEADWSAAGIAGQMQTNDVLLAMDNIGANKLDPYLEINAKLSLQVQGSTTLVTVSAHLVNSTPPDQSSYLAGGLKSNGLPYGEYKGIMTVDFPKYAGKARILGGRVLNIAGSDGPSQVLGTAVILLPGATTNVGFSFRLPGTHGELAIDPSARIPPTQWAFAGGGFDDASRHVVQW